MNIPGNLLYSKDHEWIRVSGNRAYIGITDHAQESLGDIVFVELPEIGDTFEREEEATNVESVKAAAPIFSPVAGSVVEINKVLEDEPEKINSDPYGSHIFVLEISNPGELEDLMNAEEYSAFLEKE